MAMQGSATLLWARPTPTVKAHPAPRAFALEAVHRSP
jgi:hypothetical protein